MTGSRTADPEVFANLADTIATQDDVLLGRGTYDYWVGHWPTSTVEPFASFINGVRKHVFSSSEPREHVVEQHAGDQRRR